MKEIKFGMALSGGCVKTSTAWTEPLPRKGIRHIVLYNIFDNSYEETAFVEVLGKLINSPHGKINVMLTLDASPFIEMDDNKKRSLPIEHQKACNWINRFPPDSVSLYVMILQDLINEIAAKNLMQYVSWQLWQEPDSEKYFHGTYQDFVSLTELKYMIVSLTGRPIYVANFTSRKKNPDYRMFVQNNEIYNEPNVYYSTSIYPEVRNVMTMEWKDNYPTRNLPGSAITAYSIGTSTNYERVNSFNWMVYAVWILQWAHDKTIDFMYFWKLVACEGEGSIYASQTKLFGGGWRTEKVWLMQMELLDVLRRPDGTYAYELIPGGIVGHTKKIIAFTNGYTIQDK